MDPSKPKSYPRTVNRRFFAEAKERLFDYHPLLLGTAELADVLGVNKQSVCNWRVRFNFIPNPVVELSQGPTWDRACIWLWIVQELKEMGEPITRRIIHPIEEAGAGYRCRGCGISVFAEIPENDSEKLCSSCRTNRLDRLEQN